MTCKCLIDIKNGETPEYGRNMIVLRSQICLHQKIDARWIQTFAERFRIVIKSDTGKHGLAKKKKRILLLLLQGTLGA